MLYFSPLGARPSVMIVFRWCPTFTGCFDPKPWHPPVGGSTVMASPLLDGSRLPAQIVRWSASPSILVVVLCVLPDIPSRVSSFHTDCAGKPLQPTSNGNSQTFHPLSLQSAIRSVYLRLFLSCVSSQFSSHGKVSSITTNVFDCWDTNTVSGFRLVSTMLGKISFLSRYILSFQSCPVSSTAFCLSALLSAVASPCLTNWICPGIWSVGRFLLLSTSSTSASSRRTLSCGHLY